MGQTFLLPGPQSEFEKSAIALLEVNASRGSHKHLVLIIGVMISTEHRPSTHTSLFINNNVLLLFSPNRQLTCNRL
eukprot:scaffold2398_cov340-Pinguiococcus_pyrenoidosus.AAC.3